MFGGAQTGRRGTPEHVWGCYGVPLNMFGGTYGVVTPPNFNEHMHFAISFAWRRNRKKDESTWNSKQAARKRAKSEAEQRASMLRQERSRDSGTAKSCMYCKARRLTECGMSVTCASIRLHCSAVHVFGTRNVSTVPHLERR